MTAGEPARLLVTLLAGADSEGLLRDELLFLAALSRADPGCVRYDVLEDVHEGGRFVLWEEWLDEASWEDHDRSPHVTRFREASTALLAEPMAVRRLRQSA